MPLSSVSKSKQSKKPRGKATIFGAVTASHLKKKIVLRVVTAVKTSNPIYLHLFYDFIMSGL
jgi:hypothetical protein